MNKFNIFLLILIVSGIVGIIVDIISQSLAYAVIAFAVVAVVLYSFFQRR